VKLLRTIRLDPSDTFVFDRVAEPGEWAVSGSFVFLNEDASALEGKARAAFRGGFLGVQSLGWSTLVQIVDATERDYFDVVQTLAGRLVAKFGAPTVADAEIAAEAEVAFASSLCTHPVDTLIATYRSEENGEIRETFRSLQRQAGSKPLRAFAFLEVEEGEDAGEWVALTNLGQQKSDK
jgi:hypothetical protein